jgi:hypothetical protein
MTDETYNYNLIRKILACYHNCKQTDIKTTEQSHELKNKHIHANLIYMKSPNRFNRW